MMKESIQMGVVSYLISQLLVLLLIKRPQTSKDSESLTVTCREILILPLHVSLIHSSSPFSPKLSGKKKKVFLLHWCPVKQPRLSFLLLKSRLRLSLPTDRARSFYSACAVEPDYSPQWLWFWQIKIFWKVKGRSSVLVLTLNFISSLFTTSQGIAWNVNFTHVLLVC